MEGCDPVADAGCAWTGEVVSGTRPAERTVAGFFDSVVAAGTR